MQQQILPRMRLRKKSFKAFGPIDVMLNRRDFLTLR